MISSVKRDADAIKVNYGDLGLKLGQLRSFNFMPTSVLDASGAFVVMAPHNTVNFVAPTTLLK